MNALVKTFPSIQRPNTARSTPRWESLATTPPSRKHPEVLAALQGRPVV